MFFLPDWKPTGQEDSYGHDIETAYLLIEAAEATGLKHDAQTAMVARRLVDHVLRVGLDSTAGGFYDSGPTGGPVRNKAKIWWTQAEALNALLLMHAEHGGQTGRYWKEFLRQWDYIANHQIDRQHRGWYPTVNANGSPIPEQRKSDAWTDPYHQGRAMMNVTDTLRRLAANKSG
jgi:mannobiose 2-epimerase